MDSSAALTLLELIEYHKDGILSRSQLKPYVAKKASTLDLITEEFQKTTSLGIPTGKLKTKWKNLISGLKDKNNHSKGTGGGAAKKLNLSFNLIYNILLYISNYFPQTGCLS